MSGSKKHMVTVVKSSLAILRIDEMPLWHELEPGFTSNLITT